jgi:hypothetical protein
MSRKFYVGETMNLGAMDELSQIPEGQAFALINLLLYKEWADYPPGTILLTAGDAPEAGGRKHQKEFEDLSV